MLAIIGGTGFGELDGLDLRSSEWLNTPYGEPSAAINRGMINGRELALLSRHGKPHTIAPHLINYRANVSALHQLGVTQILAVNAVGGIHAQLGPTHIAVPDQIIDFTYGRAHTRYDGINDELEHVDFTHPYTPTLRDRVIAAAQQAKVEVLQYGTYAATQGPRLETAAEVAMLKSLGADMVGMTGMPEAALAREFGIDYACIAVSANWCAGLSESVITMAQIEAALSDGMVKVQQLIRAFCQ